MDITTEIMGTSVNVEIAVSFIASILPISKSQELSISSPPTDKTIVAVKTISTQELNQGKQVLILGGTIIQNSITYLRELRIDGHFFVNERIEIIVR